MFNPSVVGAETGQLLGLAVPQSSSSFSELLFPKSKARSDRAGYLTSFLGLCKHVFSYTQKHIYQRRAYIPKCNFSMISYVPSLLPQTGLFMSCKLASNSTIFLPQPPKLWDYRCALNFSIRSFVTYLQMRLSSASGRD